MKNTIKVMQYALMIVLFSALPIKASAAVVYLEASHSNISVGDTIVVAVKINSEGKVINTVEGEIATKATSSSLMVKEFSLANSVLGLWPRTPSLSKDGQVVSFTGGVPGGFSIEGATVFKIVLEAKKQGAVTVSPRNFSVYENDGKGSKLPVQFKNLTINIGPKKEGSPVNNDWQSIVAGDINPPEDFIVVLGQDKTLFNAKKFAFFSAIDNQSGISYYDVSENDAPAVRTGSVYVLQDQDHDVTLKVTAYDKAGNKKVAIYSAQTAKKVFGFPVAFFIILILILIVKIILYKREKNANKRN